LFEFSKQGNQKQDQLKTSMQNSSSSHHYGCSTSEEIFSNLESLKGDDNNNRLHIKM